MHAYAWCVTMLEIIQVTAKCYTKLFQRLTKTVRAKRVENGRANRNKYDKVFIFFKSFEARHLAERY